MNRVTAVSSPAMYVGSTFHSSTVMSPSASGSSSVNAVSMLRADSGSETYT